MPDTQAWKTLSCVRHSWVRHEPPNEDPGNDYNVFVFEKKKRLQTMLMCPHKTTKLKSILEYITCENSQSVAPETMW